MSLVIQLNELPAGVKKQPTNYLGRRSLRVVLQFQV